MQKTLIILTPGFPADESDTACLPAQQQFTRTLQKHFPWLRIIIVTVQYPSYSTEYLWNNIRVISLGIQSGFYTRFAWWKIWNTLERLKKGNTLSGILSFWCTEHTLPGFWFARAYHIPHYCWLLGRDARKNNHVIKLIHPKSSELIALSDFLRNEFYKNHRVKATHVIPIGVDKDSFTEPAAERFIDVMGAGSLIPLKQYHIFVEVVKSLSISFPNLKAIIFGKGEEKDSLGKKIHELGISHHLRLMDEVPHDELMAIMGYDKIFLHPSSYEGFSSSCLEALSAGAHVISFQCPMEHRFPHWHLVHTPQEMYLKTLSLLQSDALNHEAVIPYTMRDAAEKIMDLFGNHVFAHSTQAIGNTLKR